MLLNKTENNTRAIKSLNLMKSKSIQKFYFKLIKQINITKNENNRKDTGK